MQNAVTLELLDNAISYSRLIWVMDDETADKLYELSKRHIALAKQYLLPTTSLERRKEIMQEIEALRIERNSIINQFEPKGEMNNDNNYN